MSTNRISGNWSGLKKTALLAIVISAAGIYGCSKENKNAPPQAQQQASAAPDLAKDHFDRGIQLSLKGQFDQAIKEYEESLKINPKSAEAYNDLGFAYMDKGDLDKAIENQKKAVEINPGLANAYYGLAMAQEKKGDKANAINNWKEFVKVSQPHSKWWTKAQEHIKELEKKK